MTLTPPATPRSRARRVARAAGAAGVAALVALLVTLAATDVWHLGSGGTSASGRAGAPGGSAEPGTVPVEARLQLRALAEGTGGRELTHDAPLRLLVAGDSISGGVGTALGDLTADTGIVDMYLDFRVGSGLFSGDRNWFEHAADDIREHQPETVVFFAGTNDAVVDGRFTDEEYEERVGALMDLLSTYSGTGEVAGPGPGDDGTTDETTTSSAAAAGEPAERTVLWVGAPTLRNWNDGAERVNELAARAAADREQVVYIDAFALTAVDGEYDDTVSVLYGPPARIRSGDGVHFTAAGNEYLATVIFELLDQRWGLREQAVPGRRIEFTTAQGGGRAPGIPPSTSGSGSSGSGPRTTWDTSPDPDEDDDPAPTTTPTTTPPTEPPITTPTTTPTTAPPTTAPPTTAPPTTAPPTTAPPTTAPPTTAPPTTSPPASTG